jgi:hypothetical protein
MDSATATSAVVSAYSSSPRSHTHPPSSRSQNRSAKEEVHTCAGSSVCTGVAGAYVHDGWS